MLDSSSGTSKGFLAGKQFHIVLGVTSHQTCMLLSARAKAFEAAGFRVSVLSGPGRILDDAIQNEGIAGYEIPIGRGISIFRDLGSFVRICRLLCRLHPDVVEFGTPKMGVLGSVAAWICRVPVRVYFLRGIRLETSGRLKQGLLRLTERIAAACAHFVLCNSPSVRKKALKLRLAPASRLALIGKGSSNGVDTTRFAPGATDIRRQLGIPAEAAVIGFAGRLTSDKGLPELVEAFAQILRKRDAYLLLVGWFDAAEDAVERVVRERIEGHPQIVFTGYVADTAPFYRAMDLMVLPSWREGFPNAILEAAATGVPVVSTFSTGACDAVVPEVTGLLVPPGYPEAICEACLKLLGDESRRRRMGIAAREWVTQHFGQDHVLGLTVEFYRRLISERTGAIPSLADPGAEASESSASL